MSMTPLRWMLVCINLIRRTMAERITPNEDSGLAEWAAKLASALDKSDDPDCFDLILDAIACLLPHDMAMVFVYSRRARPVLIHDTVSDPDAKRGLINYVNDTYILNPAYNAFRRGLEPGIYRINEVAPDDYFSSEHFKNFKIKHARHEEIGYITDGWPRGMEEIFLAVALPDNRLGEICLLRTASSGGFSEDGINRLRLVEPMLGATFRHHWESRHRDEGPEEAALSIDELFENFGSSLLSPREREVAELILKGHSGHSIGEHLGISITTVKSHRQNLYGKLGIATQFELFSLFLKSMPGVSV